MKKHIKFLVLAIAVLMMAMTLTGCLEDGRSAYDIAVENGFVGSESEWLDSLKGADGEKGEKGDKGDEGDRGLTGWEGEDGKSAYDLAVENGFKGTFEEWLDSLVGKDGENGKSAYDLAVENGFEGTFEEWIDSLVGKDGEDGADGKDGTHIVSSYIDEDGHLILEMNDGTTVDAGYVGLDRVDIGKEPTLSEEKVCLAPGSVYLLETNLDYPVWSSSDSKIARIAPNGLIVGMDEGTATITATSVDGKTVTCEITVLDIEYKINADGGVVITHYTGSLATVEIPDVIAGHTVTELDSNAFFDCQSVKNVILPDTVKTIGSCAFSICSNLESVDLGEGLTYLGDSAFTSCSSLENITLPETLEKMGGGVFYGCEKLKEIKIPSKITTIAGATFNSCKALTSVTMENVEKIENWAFAGCKSLTEITLPETLVEIGELAFENCTSLKDVTFNNPNTIYWSNSFEGCIFVPLFDEEGFIEVDITMYATVTSNFRSSPSLEEENVVDQILKGSEVHVIGVNILDGWARIDIEGNTYYIRWSLLSFETVENV